MRTPFDALRSVKKYVAEILSPQPSLSEFVSSDGTRWTLLNRVDGAISVSRTAFDWLWSCDRMQPEVVGSAADPEIYYLRSRLTASAAYLSAAAAGAGIDLRVGASPVVGWRLPLLPHWEVRLAYDYAEVPAGRPFCRVIMAGAASTSGAGRFYVVQQPIQIECLGLPPATADLAMEAAMQTMDSLAAGFRGDGVGLGRAIRVPLFDYEGVGLNEAASERHPSDFLRVEDFSVRLLADPDDPTHIPCVADLRVSWRVGNTVRPGTRITQEVAFTGEEELPSFSTRHVTEVGLTDNVHMP